MSRRFKVILEWNEDGGGYTVTVPSLPGCITEGDRREEALESAKEAIHCMLEGMRIDGLAMPAGDVLVEEVEVAV